MIVLTSIVVVMVGMRGGGGHRHHGPARGVHYRLAPREVGLLPPVPRQPLLHVRGRRGGLVRLDIAAASRRMCGLGREGRRRRPRAALLLLLLLVVVVMVVGARGRRGGGRRRRRRHGAGDKGAGTRGLVARGAYLAHDGGDR